MIDDSNGPEFHHVQASSMNADLEIEHQGQLGTDSALNRKSGQRSGDGNGAATRAFVLATVSAKSAPKCLIFLGCAAVSAPGYEGDSR
ncbi:MAG: hypothetical protein WAN75_46755 [Xanthobacteraceae bacterium]|jgi:hypothetical protein